MMHEPALNFKSTEYREYVDKFFEWYKKAKPGDRYVYYFGEHLHESLASEYIKRVTWDFACDGKVYIFQGRDLEDRNKFVYTAIIPHYKLARLIPSPYKG